MNKKKNTGKVYIVGAGPGDPGLFTLKGSSCLKKAEVVIYDYLVSPDILSLVTDECVKIYAGKMSSNHLLSQDEINRLLVEYAEKGKIVVRLKGGDPFMFGRGGEEALFLAEHGIPFEVVPGVTAGYAVPAYAGIPLTHRAFASDLHFITGHEDPQKKETAVNWEMLAKSKGTLVFFMGIKNLPLITKMLIQHGKAKETPAAVIRWGTSVMQETITGTIETIPQIAEKSGIKPPAIIVIGDVVQLRPRLRWFDNRPLFQKKIIVTRSRSQSSTLVASLKELGADVIEFPTISIEPVIERSRSDHNPDAGVNGVSEIHTVLSRIQTYAWIIFTSVNGVEIFFRELFRLKHDARILAHSSIAVIGAATAEALAQYGICPDLEPEFFTSEGVIEAFTKKAIDVRDKNILCPGSAIARDYIPEKLEQMGAKVKSLALYENSMPLYKESEIDSIFSGKIDLVTFTSSSTVANFIHILSSCNKEEYVKNIKGAAIGPVTARTAEKAGIPVILTAGKHTIPELVREITRYFESLRNKS